MQYVVVTTKQNLDKACQYFKQKCQGGELGLDTETASVTLDENGAFHPRTGRLSLIQLSDGDKTILIDVFALLESEGVEHSTNYEELKKTHYIFVSLKDLLEDPNITVVVHNANFEWKWMKTNCGIDLKKVFDTFLAAKVVDYNGDNDPERKHNLAAVARRWIGVDVDKTEQKSNWGMRPLSQEQLDYAALDPYYLPEIKRVLEQRIQELDLGDVAILEFNAVPPIAEPETYGLHCDKEAYAKEITRLVELRDIASEGLQEQLRPTKPNKGVQMSMFDLPERNYSDVLITSPQQVLEALQALELPVYASNDFVGIARAERSGKPFAVGTGAKALAPLAGMHPVLKYLSDFRGVDKMVTGFGPSFVERLKQDDDGNWRVYMSFNQIGAPTGRMSCSNPNTQQIPDKKIEIGDTEYDLGFRMTFTAPKGKKLVIADYSQIELRIVTEFSGDPVFMNAYGLDGDGKDIHALTASLVFNVPYELCIDESHEYYHTHRKFAKRINFGIVYGIGPQGLSGQLKCSVEEAKEIIDKHRNGHPVLWDYLDSAALNAIKRLEAKTAMGRIQKFNPPSRDEKGMPNKKEQSMIGRNGKNMPIQGCVGGDTRILVQGVGYTKIGEAEKGQAEIWEGDEFVNGVIAESGLKLKTVVKFDSGNKIVCSPEHKFWAKAKAVEPAWVEAKDLTKSHAILLGYETPDFDFFPTSQFDRLVGANSFEIGTILASYYLFGGRDGDLINFDIPEEEYEHQKILTDAFDKIGLVYDEDTLFRWRRKYRTRLKVNSHELRQFIADNNLKKGFSDCIWTSKPMIAGILKVLFNYSEMKSGMFQLRIDKDFRKLGEDLQQALYLFGVNAHRIEGLNKDFLYLSKKDLLRYIIRVGIIKDKKVLTVTDYKTITKFRTSKAFNTTYLKVYSVEQTNEAIEMFDVVDSTSSRFMANGLVTHNTSADILKRALRLIYDEKQRLGLNCHVVNIVHDEIMLESDEEDAEKAREALERCMRQAGEETLKKVKVKVDAKIIENWGQK